MGVGVSADASREAVIDHIERVQTMPTFGAPTDEEYRLFDQHMDFARSQHHQLNRDKRQVSIDLGVVMNEFEALFIGKSVLDIGCGVGVLSGELARLKRTRVTALDHDPEVLDRVPNAKNIIPVLGSGYDVAAAVGDEKFDVIISSFSSYFWARSESDKRASVLSPLGSCATGGKAIWVPVIAEPSAKDGNRVAIEGLEQRKQQNDLDENELAELDEAKASVRVSDWLDVVGIGTLLDEEEQGRIDCTFLASRDNARKLQLKGSTHAVLERYSAIATTLAA